MKLEKALGTLYYKIVFSIADYKKHVNYLTDYFCLFIYISRLFSDVRVYQGALVIHIVAEIPITQNMTITKKGMKVIRIVLS
jgi:hypothetical protein